MSTEPLRYGVVYGADPGTFAVRDRHAKRILADYLSREDAIILAARGNAAESEGRVFVSDTA